MSKAVEVPKVRCLDMELVLDRLEEYRINLFSIE